MANLRVAIFERVKRNGKWPARRWRWARTLLRRAGHAEKDGEARKTRVGKRRRLVRSQSLIEDGERARAHGLTVADCAQGVMAQAGHAHQFAHS